MNDTTIRNVILGMFTARNRSSSDDAPYLHMQISSNLQPAWKHDAGLGWTAMPRLI